MSKFSQFYSKDVVFRFVLLLLPIVFAALNLPLWVYFTLFIPFSIQVYNTHQQRKTEKTLDKVKKLQPLLVKLDLPLKTH